MKNVKKSEDLKVPKKAGDGLIISDEGMEKFFGTKSQDFALGLFNQIVNMASHCNEYNEEATLFGVSIVGGIKPGDQVEAMLAVQMAAIHNATMTFSRRLAHTQTLQQQDSASRALNQLARTFTTQVEALKRYRTGGQQSVTVKHVTVNEGGQAIVGNVSTGGRDGNGN